MSRYLLKYVGTYRVKAEYDQSTNDFPRDFEGHIDSSFEDLYIDCAHGCKIMHHDSRGVNVTLFGYVPSLQRGHNIVKSLGDLVINSDESSSEVWFYFSAKDIESVAEVMKAKTAGSSISPFSVKNLPKNSYEINTEDMDVYKAIIKELPKNELIYLSLWTKAFMNGYRTKSRQILGSDAAKKEGLSSKNYIHKHGYWEDYCKYLQDCIKKHKEELS